MFEKFNTNELKKQVTDRLATAKDGVSSTMLSVKESLDDTVGEAKDAIKDFTLMNKIRDFSSSSVNIVADIDDHLAKNNAPYEVSTFRVSANMGVMAGMTLDIHFTKSTTAKNLTNEVRSNLVVTNPKTGKSFKVPKSAFGDKEEAKVKDPNNGEVLLINTKSGQIIGNPI
jgi:hypothetical protein